VKKISSIIYIYDRITVGFNDKNHLAHCLSQIVLRRKQHMTFTKADLINKVHTSNPKLTKAQARKAVEAILRIIKSSLGNGEDVLMSGFGKLSVKDKAVRKGRNPQTGESMMLDARRVITFRPSGKLREKVNGE